MNTGKTLFAQRLIIQVRKLYAADSFGVELSNTVYALDATTIDLCLSALTHTGAFFVTRTKSNLNARRLYSAPTDRGTGLICDQTIALNGFYSSQHYPQHLHGRHFNEPFQ